VQEWRCFNICLSWSFLHMQASRLVVAVDDDGCFTEKVSEFKGRHVKEADKDIINAVKASQFQFPMVCQIIPVLSC
jgi:isoleucyl-tRNA synthetase